MKRLIEQIRKEDGQVLVLAALLMVVLLGFAALAIDVGMVQLTKAKMQNAADAAALAGAYDLPSKSTAESTAKDYAELNGVERVNTTATAHYEGDPNKIEVVCTKNVSYSFARVLGFTDADVSARAVAEKSDSSNGISGLRPWAVADKYKVGGTWVDYTYTYGLEFELKAGGGGGSNGYYGIVAFGDQNANAGDVYKDNIENGYDGVVEIGDLVKDGHGNVNVKNVINALMTKSGDTIGDYTKATKGNSRVVIIPKIDAQTRQVIGFAAIYLKSVDNQGYITANFLYDTTWPEEDKDLYEDWGLNSSIRLTE